MTAFRILAERIAEGNLIFPCFICNMLSDDVLIKYIEKYFKPTKEEAKKFKLYFNEKDNWVAFFSSAELADNYDNLSDIKKANLNRKDNSFRILILLFAEQHYLHYKKIDEK